MDKGSGSGIFPDPDPDPGDPKKTESGSYLDMFWMFRKINICIWHFLTKFNHLMTLKINKDKQLDETVF